jgi:serine/threonine protein phosphatase PrpC
MSVSVAVRTDVGGRDHNEDCVGSFPWGDGVVVALADGMGGHEDGEVASNVAVLSALHQAPPSDGPVGPWLRRSVELADRRVREAGRRAGNDMGTTLVVAAVRHGKLYVAHVGDSRCGIVRDGVLRWVTRDHTVRGVLLSEGRIRPEEWAHYDGGLLQCVGGRQPDDERSFEVESAAQDLLPGDVVVLTTDGLHEFVSPARIAEIVSPCSSALDPVPAVQLAATLLVAAALSARTTDNATCVVVCYNP